MNGKVIGSNMVKSQHGLMSIHFWKTVMNSTGGEQTLTTSFFEDLKPLFSSPLPTYQKIAEVLQLYDASKSSNESMKATCYPWTVPTGLNNPEIAMLIVTSGYNDSDWQLSITDKIQYAKQHGYDLHMFNESVGGRHPSWTKIPAVLSLMDSYDWIFGIDMDTIILNHGISLESFLDPSAKVVLNVDLNGLNFGVYLVRACSWAKMLLIDAWTHSDLQGSDIFWEQTAITLQMNNYLLRNRAKFVPQKFFNQYPKDGEVSAEDTFIVHFAGRSDKLDQVRKYFDRRVAVMEDSHIIRSEDID